MLDIKFIRENPDLVKEAMKKRNADLDKKIDKILSLDITRRELTAKVEKKKSQQNIVTKKNSRDEKKWRRYNSNNDRDESAV